MVSVLASIVSDPVALLQVKTRLGRDEVTPHFVGGFAAFRSRYLFFCSCWHRIGHHRRCHSCHCCQCNLCRP